MTSENYRIIFALTFQTIQKDKLYSLFALFSI